MNYFAVDKGRDTGENKQKQFGKKRHQKLQTADKFKKKKMWRIFGGGAGRFATFFMAIRSCVYFQIFSTSIV